MFSSWMGGEPLENWAFPGYEGSQGTCPPGLCPCSPVIEVVLSGEEAASPAVALEAPWLGLRLQSAWESVPALLLGILGRGRGLALSAWE